ncbi:hypothetical protein HanLR1_Chr00c2939g0861671 [Helianthus annuus]|nr:hypothetical protein HanLR1_Chr00c2939g0861671 [Helianthus annuus]
MMELGLEVEQVTSRSVDHVQCFNEAAGRLQESGNWQHLVLISICTTCYRVMV